MAASALSSHRARLLTAALLAAPPANPWTRTVLFPTCRRPYIVSPCLAGEFSRTSRKADSSYGKQRPSSGSSSSSSSRSSAENGRGQQPGSHQQKSSQPARYGRDHSPNSSRSNSRRDSTSSIGSNVNQQAQRSGVAHNKGPQQHSPTTQSPAKRSTYGSNSSSSSSRATPPPISSPIPQHAPLLVVGAGAAGLTAAYFAAKQGAQVVVLERTREAGKKVLMSGGTRCNVLPLEVDLPLDYFSSSSRSALRAVFSSWSLDECHEWLDRQVGLSMVLEEETRKWFPASNSGREVRDRLVAACQELGVKFVYNASVEQITPPAAQQQPPPDTTSSSDGSNGSNGRQVTSSKQRDGVTAQVSSTWSVQLASDATVSADRLVISTGGYSFPAVGTDGTGLRLLKGLGHKLSDGGCYAALTPLKGPHPGGEQLAGLTLAGVRLSVMRGNTNKVLAAAQRGGLLFTHKGYSGPAVLDVSHWLVKEIEQQRGQGQQQQQLPRLVVDWTGEGLQVWQESFAAASGATTVNQLLRKHGIKERLAAALALEVGVPNKPLSQLKKGEKEQLLTALTAWELPIKSHEGYPKAEVTGGGVPLEQVDCKTMESRVLPGLYLCGEVLDVFGRIGGFNFWWAWLSGRLAGQAAGAAAAGAAAGARKPEAAARAKQKS